MFVQQLWRYPVKSMAGERITEARTSTLDIAGDRAVLVVRRDRIVTSRTHHQLLGFHGTTDDDGVARIDGQRWDSPEALALVRGAIGPDVVCTSATW